MISAGVCDKKKQNDLFNRICNQLKIFPSYGEQSFCEAFRTYAAVDTFVYGQSLYRIALCNEEGNGNIVLRLMEKRFDSNEWKRFTNDECDCAVWLNDVYSKVNDKNS